MPDRSFAHCEHTMTRCQSLFSSIVENSVNGILIVDEGGSILFVNSSAVNMLGRPSLELIGNSGEYLLNMGEAGEGVFTRGDGSWLAAEVNVVCTEWNGNPAQVVFLRDITDRKRTEEALKTAILQLEEEKSKSEAIIAAIGDGISIHDTGYRIIYQNRIHKDMMGDHLGEQCYKAYACREAVCTNCHMIASFTDGSIHTVERSLQTTKGQMHFEITVSPLKDHDGKVIAGIEVVRDISERKRTEERLRYMSSHDILTGLYNRFYFEQELERLRQSRHFPLSVFMADVDDLKVINDTLGHSAGDEMLTRAAHLFREAFRTEDVVARIGGDEFAVLLPDTDAKAAQEIVVRIRASLTRWNDSRSPQIGLSLGIDTATHGDELLETLKNADQRLFDDKFLRTGRTLRRLPRP